MSMVYIKQIVMLLLFGLALGIPQANAKKKSNLNCNDLGSYYKRKMDSAPYKRFADKQVKKCVSTYTVNPKTIPVFIAAAFYYKNNEVRQDAMSRLEEYSCEDKISCGDFYVVLNKHVEAWQATKDSEKFFLARASKLRNKTFVTLNSMKNAKE